MFLNPTVCISVLVSSHPAWGDMSPPWPTGNPRISFPKANFSVFPGSSSPPTSPTEEAETGSPVQSQHPPPTPPPTSLRQSCVCEVCTWGTVVWERCKRSRPLRASVERLTKHIHARIKHKTRRINEAVKRLLGVKASVYRLRAEVLAAVCPERLKAPRGVRSRCVSNSEPGEAEEEGIL